MMLYKVKGFSLLELLVTIFLGTLLLEIVASSYLVIKKIATMEERMVTANDSARIAIFLLWQNIMQAGAMLPGEGKNNFRNVILPTPLGEFGICGYDARSNMPSHLSKRIALGTDAIEILKGNARSVQHLERITFYVGKTQRLDGHRRAIVALYMITNGRDVEELVPAVESMRIRYGLLDDGRYVFLDATNMSAKKLWGNVAVVMLKFGIRNTTGIAEYEIFIRLRARNVYP